MKKKNEKIRGNETKILKGAAGAQGIAVPVCELWTKYFVATKEKNGKGLGVVFIGKYSGRLGFDCATAAAAARGSAAPSFRPPLCRRPPAASFTGFPGFFYRVFLGFIERRRVLLTFIDSFLVLLHFTRFYWVLPGFTGFYWVLLDLTVFY